MFLPRPPNLSLTSGDYFPCRYSSIIDDPVIDPSPPPSIIVSSSFTSGFLACPQSHFCLSEAHRMRKLVQFLALSGSNIVSPFIAGTEGTNIVRRRGCMGTMKAQRVNGDHSDERRGNDEGT
ncbi:hypothetical protein L1887_29182 [Cichorium endivia]|nr:hypothetical protein L1887_29182 [Cichorium endivia]